MASVSRLVERHSAVLQGVAGARGSDVQVELEEGALPPLDLGGGADLEAQLAPFMPLAGLPLPEGTLADTGAAGRFPEALGQGGVGSTPEGDEEVPRWTFLMNAEQRRAHRGPSAPHAPSNRKYRLPAGQPGRLRAALAMVLPVPKAERVPK